MNKKATTVWVLTRECNDYDQHGAYFEAVFSSEPTLLQLADYFKDAGMKMSDAMSAVAFLEHLRQGGGRRGNEHAWYNLEQVEMR